MLLFMPRPESRPSQSPVLSKAWRHCSHLAALFPPLKCEDQTGGPQVSFPGTLVQERLAEAELLTVSPCPAVASGDQGFPVRLHQWHLLYPPLPAPGSPQNAPADSPALGPWVRPVGPVSWKNRFPQLLRHGSIWPVLSHLLSYWVLTGRQTRPSLHGFYVYIFSVNTFYIN